MKRMKILVFVALLATVAGCSLPPERPYTRQDIFKTNVFSSLTIKESPDAVLAQLNKDGEVVLEGVDKKNKSYFIRLMSGSKDIKVEYKEK
jgi:hypothetical protein